MIFIREGQKYKLGGKLFPLNPDSKMKSFFVGNTEKYRNIEFAKRLDKEIFEMGKCYSNAEKVVAIGKQMGLEIQFYCGWVFIGQRLPLHHAWAVVNETYPIDPSMSDSEMKIFLDVETNTSTTKDDWRIEIAPRIIECRNQNMNNSMNMSICDDKVYGQVFAHTAYVGCPDTMENAINVYRRLRKKYPNHPSYIHNKTEDKFSRTKLQEEISKIDKAELQDIKLQNRA